MDMHVPVKIISPTAAAAAFRTQFLIQHISVFNVKSAISSNTNAQQLTLIKNRLSTSVGKIHQKYQNSCGDNLHWCPHSKF